MNRIFSNLSIKSRVTVMLVLVTLLSSIIIGVLGWQTGRRALQSAIVNQLSTVRLSQTLQIEKYFDQIFRHTRTLAENRMIVNAVKQFQEGFNVGLNRTLSEEQYVAVTKFYDEKFTPKLSRSSGNKALSVLYRPRRNITNYFQYHYIVDNPYPLGDKEELIESEQDSTFYNRFHKFYHPLLRNLQNEFDYYDLFLIDTKSLNIVYSVFKETDFATNLIDGPYSETALGVLAKKIREQPERGVVSVADYRPYAPSYGAPAAFVGAPIFDGNEAIGIIALQLPVDRINSVMTNDGEWAKYGLGKTGESFLTGPDQFMRSISRPYTEDKPGYIKELRESGASASTVRNIQNHKTTVLFQPVVSTSVTSALEDKSGTHLATNYLGEQVLSSYGPVKVQDLDWVIVSEISAHEAFQPIRELQRTILVCGVILILVVAFLAMVLARFFVRPIDTLTRGVQSLASGETDTHVDLKSEDEFGELAESFNFMAETIQAKTKDVEKLRDENQHLLQNIMPPSIASRVRNGERVADRLQQVSVAFLKIDGLNDYSHSAGTAETARKLSTLYDMFDEFAVRHDVESFKTIGNTYIAACGVTLTRLDHSKRVLEFAIALMKLLQSFNSDHHTEFTLSAGIDSGAVSAGIIGTNRFSYELWGEPVDIAQHLVEGTTGGHIVVSSSAHDRLKSFYTFKPGPAISDSDTVAWILDASSTEVAALTTPASAS